MAMETIKLAAKLRDGSKKAKKLRQESLIPAVMYGHGTKNRNVTLVYNEFGKVFRTAGESSLIDLAIEGEKSAAKVLVKDVQVEPLSGRYSHIDFYEVNLNEKLKAEVMLNFLGESPAVKELGGSLIKNLDHVKVECLPGDLVHQIDIDLTALKAFGDMIHVSDLKAPKGVEILDNPRAVVVLIEAPLTEDQLKALEGPVTADVTAIKTEAEVKKAEEEAKKAAEAPAEEEKK